MLGWKRVSGECSHTRVTPRVLDSHCLRSEMKGYICCVHDGDDDNGTVI
jgi:hypothetical protein